MRALPTGRFARWSKPPCPASVALTRVPDAAVVDALAPATLADAGDEAAMRQRMIKLIALLGKEYDSRRGRAVDHLVSLLDDHSNAVRIAAIRGLEKIGDLSTIEKLKPLTGDDQPRRVRKAARSAIKIIGASNGDGG